MQKIILFLSVILILCAVGGIIVFMPKKPQVVTEEKVEQKKIKINILVANDEIEVAQPLNLTNTRVETIEFENQVPENFRNLITKEEFDVGSPIVANKTITANQYINKQDFVYVGSDEYAKLILQPTHGQISFMFALDERDYAILSQLKPSDYVDVFFRYETKNPKRDDGIAPKKRKDNEYNNYDSANITSLMPLFIHKKVLFNKKFVDDDETEEVEKAQKDLPKTKGYIFVELSKDDAKKFYTLENLGNFFIFPSETNVNNKMISTENILQKEFIKELRGNKHGKN